MQYATHYGRDAAVCNALIANLIIWLNKNQGKHSWPQSNSLYLFSGLRSLSQMPSCIRLVRVILVRVILAGRGLQARKLPTGDNCTIFGKKRGCYMLNCFTASHSPHSSAPALEWLTKDSENFSNFFDHTPLTAGFIYACGSLWDLSSISSAVTPAQSSTRSSSRGRRARGFSSRRRARGFSSSIRGRARNRCRPKRFLGWHVR